MSSKEFSGKRILVEGRNCWRIAKAHRIAFLIDAASYFAAFVEAVKRARQSVLIIGWDINSRIHLLRDDQAHDLPTQLGDFLNAVASKRSGLHIHILNWDFAVIYAAERELFPVFKFGWRTHRRVHFRMDGNHPTGASHHQKIVVVDDAVAFVGGLDLSRDRWDTTAHRAQDSRRINPRGEPYAPFHDVQMAVDGLAARALGELARRRWLRGTAERLQPPATEEHDPWPSDLSVDLKDAAVAIARTEAAHEGRTGIREIEKLHRDAIASARESIYIENQYLTSSAVCEVLCRRLEEASGPEIVIILPRKCSGWLEQTTMDVLRARTLAKLRKADKHNRLRLYYRDVAELVDDHLHLHAKVLIVDDTFVKVGSSNLNNRSMGLDTECDLAIEAEEKDRQGIGQFRNRLLGEHLGMEAEKIADELADTGSLISTVEALGGSSHTLVSLPLDDVPHWLDKLISSSTVPVDPEKPISSDELLKILAPAEIQRPQKRRLWVIAPVILLMLGLAAAWRWTGLGDWLDLDTIIDWASYLQGSATAPFVVTGCFVVGSLIMFPVTVLIIATAVVFEPVTGFSYSLIGSLLASVTTYAVGRFLGRDTIRQIAGPRLNDLNRRITRHGLLTTTALRIIPVAPFTVVNLAAGAARIRVRDFVMGTLLGMTPGILAITAFERSLEEVIREPKIEHFILVVALAVGVLSVFLTLRRWLTGRHVRGVQRNDQDRKEEKVPYPH